MRVSTVAHVLSFQLVFHPILANFDCESTNFPLGTCNSQLKCIYDEAYEGPTTSCRCKIVITAISLPANTLNYNLLNKMCSTHKLRMQQLQVNDAELERIDDQIFESYPNLKYVNLAGNRMRLNFSEKAEGLTELDVSFNEIASLRSITLDNLRFLKTLNMSFNRLEENGLFTKLYKLEELYLNNNHLTSVRYSDFNHLHKLRILNLAYNFVASLDHQLKLPRLQELYLNNNKLVSLKRYDFRNLQNLKVLNLAGNLISKIENNAIASTRGNGNFQDSQTSKTSRRTEHEQNDSKSSGPGLFFFTIPQNGVHNAGGNPFQFRNPQSKGYFNFGNNFLSSNEQNRQNTNANFNIFQSFNESILQSQRNLAEDQQNFASYLVGKNRVSEQSTSVPQVSEESYARTWTKLQDLNLAENRINFFPDGFFDNLGELRKLNISHNELAMFDLMKIKDSAKLTIFDIKRNHLNQLNLKLFIDKWSLLEVVDLDLNLINCDESLDILDYFKGNGIVLKGCVSKRCCGRIFGLD